MAVGYIPTRYPANVGDRTQERVEELQRLRRLGVLSATEPCPDDAPTPVQVPATTMSRADQNEPSLTTGASSSIGFGILSGPAVPLSAQRAYTRGPLGTYRLVDRDYWRDVADTLGEAMDLPLPYGELGEIEGRIHLVLRHLYSFPSVRCHLTTNSEWYGESTLAPTDQWVRDGVDAVQAGRMIEYWLQELRDIIRGAPRIGD